MDKKYLLTLGLGLAFTLVGCQNKEAELARIAELEEAIEAKEKALAEQERQAADEAGGAQHGCGCDQHPGGAGA